jgi:hypothetical protein
MQHFRLPASNHLQTVVAHRLTADGETSICLRQRAYYHAIFGLQVKGHDVLEGLAVLAPRDKRIREEEGEVKIR